MSEHTPPTTAFGAVPSEDSSRALLEQIFARFPGMAHPASLQSEAAPGLAAPPATNLANVPAFESACAGSDCLPAGPAISPELPQPMPGHLPIKSLPKTVLEAIERLDKAPQEHPIAFEHFRASLQQAEVAQNELRRLSFAKQLGRGKSPSERSVGGASVPSAASMTPGRFVTPSRPLDVASVRSDFPALDQSINGHDLIWFDNAATTQKPQAVIDAMSNFYARDYSNIHRAAHTLAARATDHYESARETVREFIHAGSVDDIVFVRGTTEGINFIANTVGGSLQEGDEILLSEMEHHANIVPWQMVARQRGAKIRVIPFDDRGELMMDEYRRLLSLRTKVVSVTHASNTLGTILPVEEIGSLAHKYGARYVIDGAQSVAHLPIDVTALNCDFFVFSGHKVYAPTGIGAVYIRPEIQETLPPWQGGGNMIHRVTFDETTYAFPPNKFEAGTPSIGDAVGLETALRYLRQFDIQSVASYEHGLLEHAWRELSGLDGVRLIGGATHRTGLVSFVIDGLSTEHVGQELDRHGIAVRTGHHCAQPSLRHYGLESTIRPSFAIYNTHAEIDRMISVIRSLHRQR